MNKSIEEIKRIEKIDGVLYRLNSTWRVHPCYITRGMVRAILYRAEAHSEYSDNMFRYNGLYLEDYMNMF
jgi:hypothetical protein